MFWDELFMLMEKISMTRRNMTFCSILLKTGTLHSAGINCSRMYGGMTFGDDRTVDTHIKMLRNSLGEYRKFIVTLRGMGYKFEATRSLRFNIWLYFMLFVIVVFILLWVFQILFLKAFING